MGDGPPEVQAARHHVAALKGVLLDEVEKSYNDKLAGMLCCPLAFLLHRKFSGTICVWVERYSRRPLARI